MARIIGGIAASHTPTIGFAFDRNKRDDPVWAPIFEHFAPVAAVARREAARRAAVRSTTITSPRSSSTTTRRSRSGVGTRVARRRRGRRRARAAADQGASAARRAHRARADGRRVRHVVLPGQGAGPRLLLAAVDALPARAGRGRRRIVPLQVGVLQFPIPTRAPLLQARPGAAPRDRELSGGPEGRHRRHRRAVAPGARRARGLQQPAVGQRFLDLFESDPEQLAEMTHRRIRRARRLRGRRSHHVAHDARRAVGERRSASTAATTCRR